mmetsp:Transcript_108256/g.305133  ORF Transcript_108256/g.305133 Transcript_108256/m.305133 type:complete len:213 (-) Transcript_108256:1009-1647(-)
MRGHPFGRRPHSCSGSSRHMRLQERRYVLWKSLMAPHHAPLQAWRSQRLPKVSGTPTPTPGRPPWQRSASSVHMLSQRYLGSWHAFGTWTKTTASARSLRKPSGRLAASSNAGPIMCSRAPTSLHSAWRTRIERSALRWPLRSGISVDSPRERRPSLPSASRTTMRNFGLPPLTRSPPCQAHMLPSRCPRSLCACRTRAATSALPPQTPSGE